MVTDEHLPILKGTTGIFTAANAEHDGGEEEEEAGHGEAHAVHRLVAHDDITVHLVFNPRYRRSSLTKTWYLFLKQKQMGYLDLARPPAFHNGHLDLLMFTVSHKKQTGNKSSAADCKAECRHPTFRSSVSIPGRIMMTDTRVPSNRKKENTSRVMVELLEDGQQPHRRHGAEPHKQEACEE